MAFKDFIYSQMFYLILDVYHIVIDRVGLMSLSRRQNYYMGLKVKKGLSSDAYMELFLVSAQLQGVLITELWLVPKLSVTLNEPKKERTNG